MKNYLLGNWKSYGNLAMLDAFKGAFGNNPCSGRSEVSCGLAFPLHLVAPGTGLSGFLTGSQNVSAHGEGAYTGEVHAAMLTEAGCDFSLVGHSERRQYFHESVEDTARKLERLVAEGLTPVFCVGETQQQRAAGELRDVLETQLAPILNGFKGPELVIAYEPVWAIGTGLAATPSDAGQAHGLIRSLLPEHLRDTPILYGGSVKPGNAAELAGIDEINGFLVGGASLKGGDFRAIVDAYLAGKGL